MRKLKKKLINNIPFVRVLSQKVSNVSLQETYQSILQTIRKKEKALFFALNINILVQLHKDQDFKHILEKKAKIIFADGVPIVWLAFFSGNKIKGRVSGTDLVEKVLNNSKCNIFLLGSSERVLQQASKKYASVCGFYSPPFGTEWMNAEKEQIAKNINNSKATIVLVALGPLKQEKWLIDNFDHIDCNVGIGVGSALDILVAAKPRAPWFMKDYGFEWVWRIFLEPRRLAVRYAHDFIGLVQIIFLSKK